MNWVIGTKVGEFERYCDLEFAYGITRILILRKSIIFDVESKT